MDFIKELNAVIGEKAGALVNPKRRELIKAAVRNKEVLVSARGALATWTRVESTGRSPKDTLTVRRPEIEAEIDWDSPNNLPLAPETFAMILEDALKLVRGKERLYVTDRVVGADSRYALPVRTVSDHAKTALFTVTMFRPVPRDIGRSVYHDQPFTLLALPADKLDKLRYAGKLRKLADGTVSDMVVAMDFVSRIGVVIGSAYMGSVKKLMFTVMNYLLPKSGILPLHASANEGQGGDIALFLGLSGTGKTTLSTDPDRALIGDDEHGWDDAGVFNFEGGCYAKCINLSPANEPDIYNAIRRDALLENVVVDTSGEIDFTSAAKTENTRVSYPIYHIDNIVRPVSRAGHATTVIFLTADAFGVLPPVARLTEEQTRYYFLSGYTAKVAGTERGIVEPLPSFSACFGAAFLMLDPIIYAHELTRKMRAHKADAWLVNTGWTGGPYGSGKRMDLPSTRNIIDAILNRTLDKAEFVSLPVFNLSIPTKVAGVPEELLDPRKSWGSSERWTLAAKELASKFIKNFGKFTSNTETAKLVSSGPEL